MRPLRTSLALALVAAAGCTLPARDNPRDSSNAPVAALAVSDYGFPVAGGGCAGLVGTVVAASRGRCLALDASASADPQDEALTFDFDRVTVSSAGEVVVADELAALDGDAAIVQLPDELRRQLPVSTAEVPQLLRFRVTVRDGHGGSSEATAPLQLFNAEPIAAPAVSRTIPLGGFAWAPGAPMELAFDATGSSDPDADPLLYCWRFPEDLPAADPCDIAPDADGFVCSGEVAHACFTRTFDPGRRTRYLALLEARDNLDATIAAGDPRALRSRQIRHAVAVEDPVVWLIPPQNSSDPASRLDTERRTLALPEPSPLPTFPPIGISYFPSPASVALLDRQDSGAIAIGFSGATESAPYLFQHLEIRTWPELEPAIPIHQLPWQSDPYPMRTVAVAFDPAREKLWALAHGNQDWELERWSVPADVASSSLDIAMQLTDIEGSVDSFGNSARVGLIGVDSAGTVWMSQILSNEVRAVRENLVEAPTFQSEYEPPPVNLPEEIVFGLAIRPGTAEAWVAWVDPFYEERASVRIHRVGAAPEQHVFSTSAVVGLAFVDASTLWVLSAERGVLLLDVPTFLQYGEEAATLLEIATPEMPTVGTTVTVDAASGDLWFAGSASTVRVTLEGTLETFDLLSPLVVEKGGALWSQRTCPQDEPVCSYYRFVERGLSASAEPVAARTQLLARRQGGIDQTTGGLWYQDFFGTLVRADAHGRTREIHSQVMLDGAADADAPRYWNVSIAPDGKTAWGTTVEFVSFPPALRDLYFIDLDDPARPVTTVVQNSSTEILEFLEASAPIPAATPFAWFDRGTGLARTILTVDGNGATAERFTVPAGECRESGGSCRVVTRAARSPKTNALCLATIDEDSPSACNGSAGNCFLHLRRISAAGVVEDLGVVPHLTPNNDSDFAVAAGGDATRDLCWVASWVRGSTDPVRITAVESAPTSPIDCSGAGTPPVHCWTGSLAGTDEYGPAAGLSLFAVDPHTVWMGSTARSWKIELDPSDVDTVLAIRTDYGIGGFRLTAP